jgi:hypothetical protein
MPTLIVVDTNILIYGGASPPAERSMPWSARVNQRVPRAVRHERSGASGAAAPLSGTTDLAAGRALLHDFAKLMEDQKSCRCLSRTFGAVNQWGLVCIQCGKARWMTTLLLPEHLRCGRERRWVGRGFGLRMAGGCWAWRAARPETFPGRGAGQLARRRPTWCGRQPDRSGGCIRNRPLPGSRITSQPSS